MKMIKTLPLLALLCSAAAAHAQISGTTLQINDSVTFGLSPDPGSFEWRDNGIFIATGVAGQGALLSTDAGTGPRFLWHAGKAALRAGVLDLIESNIGSGSVAFGAATASGQYSFAMGQSTASGTYSVAIGGSLFGANWANTASGGSSASIGGFNNVVTGFSSGTFGGVSNTVTGGSSFASGGGNTASAERSAVFGYGNRAESYNTFVIGSYNVGGFTSNNNGNSWDDGNTQWIATDPLFEIGNGSPVGMNTPEVRSNALTVYKNGSAVFQGVVRVAPGGDIPMYTGN